MKEKIFFLMFFTYLFPMAVNALSQDLKQKYPFSVLTNDYGVLNGADLDSYLDGVKPATQHPREGDFYLYWQCFPHDKVTIHLRDIGYSSNNNRDENDSELTIIAYDAFGEHLYGMRRDSAVSSNVERFNRFQKIIRQQKHICIEGMYFYFKDIIANGKKKRVFYWTFEKMKTKKGCEPYFQNGCHIEKS